MNNQIICNNVCSNCHNDVPVQHPELSDATYCISCGQTHIPSYLLERPDDLPFLSDSTCISVEYDDELPF